MTDIMRTPEWNQFQELIKMKIENPEKYKEFMDSFKEIMVDFAKIAIEAQKDLEKAMEDSK